MDQASQILVIIVSAVLAIFLVVAITFLVMLIKLIKEVKKVVDKAEGMIDNVSHVGDILQNVTGKMAMVKVVNNIMKMVKKR